MVGGGGGGPLRRVGKYEVGRTIGEGTFAKVKFAQNTETGESVAMKVLDRSSILKNKMAEQVTELASFFSPVGLVLGMEQDRELLLLHPQIMLMDWDGSLGTFMLGF